MQKVLRLGALTTFGLVIICMISACTEDDLIGQVDEPTRTNLVATVPENGGIVSITGELKMFFDNSSNSVTVDGKPAIIQDNTATVKIADLPKVSSGNLKTVIIEWSNPDNSVGDATKISFTALRPPATVVVDPPPGSEVYQNDTEFTLTFNVEVLSTWVNGTSAIGSGTSWNIWTVWPELTLGPEQPLYVGWRGPGGSQGFIEIGPYRVRSPRPDGPSATDVVVSPEGGGVVPFYQQFTLSFNEPVTAVTANGVAASGAGGVWRVDPFWLSRDQTVSLTVTWTNRDGSSGKKTVGTYVVNDWDAKPPSIITATVFDGLEDADPAAINAEGIGFSFDERVTGTIMLTDGVGANLNWIGIVEGRRATLTAVAGRELEKETTYKVEIDVKDRFRNRLRTTITFATRAL